MEADERLFMNGYQTWTYSPELNRNGKLRGTDHIPGFLRKKYAFDRYGDYHFVPYGIITVRATAFPTAISARAGSFSWCIAGRNPGLHHPPVRRGKAC